MYSSTPRAIFVYNDYSYSYYLSIYSSYYSLSLSLALSALLILYIYNCGLLNKLLLSWS